MFSNILFRKKVKGAPRCFTRDVHKTSPPTSVFMPDLLTEKSLAMYYQFCTIKKPECSCLLWSLSCIRERRLSDQRKRLKFRLFLKVLKPFSTLSHAYYLLDLFPRLQSVTCSHTHVTRYNFPRLAQGTVLIVSL